jgi:hypothetical protein
VPEWKPEPIWSGQDAYIIGGGPSLQSFPWERLGSFHTVGCNDAYRLGSDLCDVCLFGDHDFFDLHKPDLRAYAKEGGVVVTNNHALGRSPLPWLYWMPRRPRGLHQDALGWNGNTGASAVNLALILGATTVHLLGFDMGRMNGKTHWFEERKKQPHESVHEKHLEGFQHVASDLPKRFPDAVIINLEDGTSRLECFPKQSLLNHFELAKKESA